MRELKLQAKSINELIDTLAEKEKDVRAEIKTNEDWIKKRRGEMVSWESELLKTENEL